MITEITRCQWCLSSEIERDYHDNEWGTPLYDDDRLFEFLCLEGAQAGLSWVTVLKKRENYREAFDQFDARKIAHYDAHKVETLMKNSGIIRNRLKINAFITNAKLFLAIQEEFGTFSQYIWSFAQDGKPQHNNWNTIADLPNETPLSQTMSKTLKKRGFKFIGPTICYAFMQATGIINDHTTDCFKHNELKMSSKQNKTQKSSN